MIAFHSARYHVHAALLMAMMAACSAEPESPTAEASMSAYNHTEDYIHQYYINGQWGGNSRPYGGAEVLFAALLILGIGTQA
ncbi:hypothetical protein GCM10009090_38060 [[Pseudomonas] boreopolis]|uniref:Uncharacterized protein n=1 Tax=Xanthomonas boreopolis TaxID=86183 RepID=A0A919FD39_9XANT|nr:hypothetical protein GCM10009090_38060 [[Pseudomonas] boreopolis]